MDQPAEYSIGMSIRLQSTSGLSGYFYAHSLLDTGHHSHSHYNSQFDDNPNSDCIRNSYADKIPYFNCDINHHFYSYHYTQPNHLSYGNLDVDAHL